ncbi:hypothetical protein [Lysobacter gummosus]|uniref:hypothetical protein n=1 Tax=Lysobacter gummosus TaxID=262324 RepID=UPI0036386BF7
MPGVCGWALLLSGVRERWRGSRGFQARGIEGGAVRRFERKASGLKPLPQKSPGPRLILWEGLQPRCLSLSSDAASTTHAPQPQHQKQRTRHTPGSSDHHRPEGRGTALT